MSLSETAFEYAHVNFPFLRFFARTSFHALFMNQFTVIQENARCAILTNPPSHLLASALIQCD